MKKRQKLALSFFLCLSIMMIIIAIIRVSRTSYSDRKIDVVWQSLWQALEGCVALVMTSITAFRTIFMGQRIRARRRKRWTPAHSWMQRAKQRKNAHKEGDVWSNNDQLPSIPQATFVKLRKYVRDYRPWTTEGRRTSSDPGNRSTERERMTNEISSLSVNRRSMQHEQSMC